MSTIYSSPQALISSSHQITIRLQFLERKREEMTMKRERSECDDEASHTPPNHVRNVVSRHGGYGLRLVMYKQLTKTDLDEQQNRLLIPAESVESNIIPMMDDNERMVANLSAPRSKKLKVSSSSDCDELDKHAKKRSKHHGVEHEGLPVHIYDGAGWRFSTVLVRRDTNSTVLRGGEWMLFKQWSAFEKDDHVEMWAFRRAEDSGLCFLLIKKN